MTTIPRDKSLDSSFAFFREGYTFLGNRSRQFRSDVFQIRLLLQRVTCLHGPEAAKVFYDPEKFVRRGAIPKRVQKTLLGQHGVQTLDAAAHQRRKEAFMAVMTPASIGKLMELMENYWQQSLAKWEKRDRVVLFEEAQAILCRAVCAWAGVPLAEAEVRQRASDFAAMVDALGAIGPRHWRGRRARRRAEQWIRGVVEDVRRQQLDTTPATALHVMAWHRELGGQLIDAPMAAVELINLLRPTVAISWYVVFAALALQHYPASRKQLRAPDELYTEWFVQEVRRFYPFAPFLGARVRTDFEWKDCQFRKGSLVLLDVYGAHHDPKLWENPEEFRPERFKNWSGSMFDFIPQGGGDYLNGHRCAGEWITMEATKVAVRFLSRSTEYEVPSQDLSFSLARIPTFPKSGLVMTNVRRVEKGPSPTPQAAPTPPRMPAG